MTQTETQDEMVLRWLLLGLPITQKTANDKLGVSRLAAIIERLEKQRGWKGYFIHERIQVTNRFGQKIGCVKYSL